MNRWPLIIGAGCILLGGCTSPSVSKPPPGIIAQQETAPAALVAVTVIGLLAGRTWRQRAAVPVIHALGCGVVGEWVSRRESSDPVRAALVQEICHWSYGLGLWRGIVRVVRGRPAQIPFVVVPEGSGREVSVVRDSELPQPV